ncbi:MAG: CBS domain-containing protein [Gammaproteobacteria bacterium]|nr:CBS domain-containing protein [Gammaproteobacteria bacterium]
MLVSKSEARCLLVVSGKQMLGIVSERDLFDAAVDRISWPWVRTALPGLSQMLIQEN